MRSHHHFGHLVKSRISESLWKKLLKRCQESGESPDHVIQAALAKELGLEQHTLFQVSTSAALVEGVYNGCMTIGELKKHGNFGLGTFDELDGEGILLDGKLWQAKSDGSVVEPADNLTSPFWVVTNFEAQTKAVIAKAVSLDDLCRQIDAFRTSTNLFAAIRIDGLFKYVQFRIACKAIPGTDLVTATANQAIFELKNVNGTLLGFWTPEYAKTFNVPGYHLHFIADDRSFAGHVLEVSGSNLQLSLDQESAFKVALPESASFLRADLSRDPAAALSIAEGVRKDK